MKTRLYRSAVRGVFCFLLLLFALLFTQLPVAAAQSRQGTVGAASLSSPNVASIDAFVSSEMQAQRIPGLSLGIVQGTRIVHLHGFGTADASGRQVTAQTPFIIGSMSKSFTALAIMQLVEAGKVELDTSVQRYLPWFRVADPASSARITVRQLLNQTGGIPANSQKEIEEGFLGSGNETLEKYVRDLSTLALDRPVDASFEYANTNYSVLGLIVQVVSGQSYETYIQQHIFAPLQMSQSFVREQDARRVGLAQGYQMWFGVPVPATLPSPRDMLPAGYVISTAEDMAQYLIAQLNGGRFGQTAVLSAAGIATLHAPAAEVLPDSSNGMGWINGPINGVPTIWHNGSTRNFYCDMILVPQSRWGIVVLTNESGLAALLSGSVEGIAAGVMTLLVGRKPVPAGLSVGTLYLIVDGLLLLISALLLWSILRLPRRSEKFGRRWRQPGRVKRGFTLARVGLRLAWELILPLFLWVPGYDGVEPGFVGLMVAFAAFTVGTIALVVIFTWVFNNTCGSLLLMVLLHTSNDAAYDTMLPLLFPSLAATPLFHFLGNMGIPFIVMALLVLVATRRRLSYERYQSQVVLLATEAVVEQEPETVDKSV